MKADPKRKPGFYWVRFEGEPQVAEWVVRVPGHPSVAGRFWLFAGSEEEFLDREVCELLSKRLTPPKGKGKLSS